ncbi:hypothetical protein niasHT_020308 [Heterodera trifolii]|uniref:polynucleotide adenylyltransferase n=1 Tax=Heterodera trifolii TaxID=157864 RepID=A0ABD2JQL5_9BILA
MQIDVKFLEIPKFARIPRKNFSAKQTEIFLLKFGQIIHKLEENDHFDEGVYWHEIRTRKEMRKKYENGKKGTENKAYEDEKEQFDKITELFHQSRRKALDERAEVKQRKEALFILAAHATNLKVLQFLLPENNYLAILERFELADAFGTKTLEKFRTIFAFLEKWAKNNQILSNELGYFNGQMLLLMLSKVFLLFPNSSLPFLIDRFFFIYSNWNWPMPVQLAKISDKKFGGFLSWSPYREWFWRRQFAWENLGKEAKKNIRMELAISVITPTFPERNMAKNVNNSSAKVLKNELKKALAKIRNKKDENAIIGPIRMSKFSEKFENFVVFKCFGTSFNVKNFCAFVGQRLRYELLEFVENPLAFWVDFCHVFPKAIALSKCPTDGSKMCELAWIVGIQMAPNQKANGTFKRKLNAKLSKKLEAKIQRDFEKGSFHNIQLKAEMASGESVRNWIAKEERKEDEEEE